MCRVLPQPLDEFYFVTMLAFTSIRTSMSRPLCPFVSVYPSHVGCLRFIKFKCLIFFPSTYVQILASWNASWGLFSNSGCVRAISLFRSFPTNGASYRVRVTSWRSAARSYVGLHLSRGLWVSPTSHELTCERWKWWSYQDMWNRWKTENQWKQDWRSQKRVHPENEKNHRATTHRTYLLTLQLRNPGGWISSLWADERWP